MTATASSSPLSQRINASTRPVHTRLNAHIIYLLPLALPPYAPDPSAYAQGISHILPIYEALEGAFRSLQARKRSSNLGGETLLQALQTLYIPQLERSQRLRNNLETLRRRCPRDVCYVRGNESSKVTQFKRRIIQATSSQPHLILSYTWILYMALFSGGRYIRGSLRRAGPDFWVGPANEKASNIDDMLSFWTFDGDQDGEDIKADFKRRFAETEIRLNEQQKQEVVREGVYIMETMCEIVQEIALVVGGAGIVDDEGSAMLEKEDRWHMQCERHTQQKNESTMQWLLFKHILPMGMAELITGAASVVARHLGPWYKNVASAEAEVG